MNFSQFKSDLKEALIVEINSHVEELIKHEISSFDLGVHPWFGYFELSFLTKDELLRNHKIKYDIASWKFYNINDFQTE